MVDAGFSGITNQAQQVNSVAGTPVSPAASQGSSDPGVHIAISLAAQMGQGRANQAGMMPQGNLQQPASATFFAQASPGVTNPNSGQAVPNNSIDAIFVRLGSLLSASANVLAGRQGFGPGGETRMYQRAGGQADSQVARPSLNSGQQGAAAQSGGQGAGAATGQAGQSQAGNAAQQSPISFMERRPSAAVGLLDQQSRQALVNNAQQQPGQGANQQQGNIQQQPGQGANQQQGNIQQQPGQGTNQQQGNIQQQPGQGANQQNASGQSVSQQPAPLPNAQVPQQQNAQQQNTTQQSPPGAQNQSSSSTQQNTPNQSVSGQGAQPQQPASTSGQGAGQVADASQGRAPEQNVVQQEQTGRQTQANTTSNSAQQASAQNPSTTPNQQAQGQQAPPGQQPAQTAGQQQQTSTAQQGQGSGAAAVADGSQSSATNSSSTNQSANAPVQSQATAVVQDGSAKVTGQLQQAQTAGVAQQGGDGNQVSTQQQAPSNPGMTNPTASFANQAGSAGQSGIIAGQENQQSLSGNMRGDTMASQGQGQQGGGNIFGGMEAQQLSNLANLLPMGGFSGLNILDPNSDEGQDALAESDEDDLGGATYLELPMPEGFFAVNDHNGNTIGIRDHAFNAVLIEAAPGGRIVGVITWTPELDEGQQKTVIEHPFDLLGRPSNIARFDLGGLARRSTETMGRFPYKGPMPVVDDNGVFRAFADHDLRDDKHGIVIIPRTESDSELIGFSIIKAAQVKKGKKRSSMAMRSYDLLANPLK